MVKTAAHVALQFENTWLSRYPRPINITYDQGGEFIGYHFRQMLQRHDITPHPISSKNPQANSVCERMHQAIGNVLRIVVSAEDPKTKHEADAVIAKTFGITMHACRCAANSSMDMESSGALAFHRDTACR